jgi:K+-sensing histidine kinase KdpD
MKSIYFWTEWLEPNSIRLLSEHEDLSHLRNHNSYSLSEVIVEEDYASAADYFKHISEGSSSILFRIYGDKSQTIDILCITFHDDSGMKSLWIQQNENHQNSIPLFAEAAHDLRTPLNSIIGLANIIQLMLRYDDLDKPKLNEITTMIKNGCNNALNYTSDLLELAEIGSKNLQLKKESVKLNDFILLFINTHRLITLKKRIKLKLETDLSEAVTININKTKITRVLINLLSNAVKFSNTEGTINFKLEQVNHKIAIHVIDDGIGMSKSIQENLFTKFGSSRRLGLEGEVSHGLGMSIVKEIIELHNGEIKVTSKENEGTKISLIF